MAKTKIPIAGTPIPNYHENMITYVIYDLNIIETRQSLGALLPSQPRNLIDNPNIIQENMTVEGKSLEKPDHWDGSLG